MKATGIVRRIDELGRIVIPKEIRRTLRIRESDPMEIFTNHEGGIVLKKYSPIGELGDTAQEYVESVANVAKCTVCVADRDRIVAAAGSQSRQYTGKDLDETEMLLEQSFFCQAIKTRNSENLKRKWLFAVRGFLDVRWSSSGKNGCHILSNNE